MNKKLLFIAIIMLILSGCKNDIETPTSAVETYLHSYQIMDKSITENSNIILDKEDLTDEQRKKFKKILEKQYQNLSYKITNETITDEYSEVDVEIEVLDYSSTISKAKEYFNEHKEEFLDEKDVENILSTEEFVDYKLEELEKTKEKTKYSLTFRLKKVNDNWKIESISDFDIMKIYGMY